MRRLTLLGCMLSCLIALPAVLAGCHRHRVRDELCPVGQPYLRAQSVPPLKTSDGLAAPNTHNALKIPEVTAPARARRVLEGCLDEAPSFFPGRPKPGQTAAASPGTASPPPAPTPAPPAPPAPSEGPSPEAPK
jgi:hypothetical protein